MAGCSGAARAYFDQYKGSPAQAYMEARGLGAAAEKFGIGFVGSARTGHEHLAGFLAIPYLRPARGGHGVATIRFRCIADECVKDESGCYLAPAAKETHRDHGKYRSLPGDHPRIYNTAPLVSASRYVALSEGEFDTQASDLAGVPCAAIQGTSAWRDHFAPAFAGFEIVFIVADDDPPGIAAAEKRAAEIPAGRVIVLGGGHDINSFVHTHGVGAYRKRLGFDS
jgi:DNA primase